MEDEDFDVSRFRIAKLEPSLGWGVVFTVAMAALFIGGIMSIAYLGDQQRDNLPKEYALETVAGDLNFPIQFDIARDGRIFFNEFVTGNIRIIEDGVLLEDPFATVDVFVDAGATGLIGIAIQEPFVYVFYTYSRLSGEAVCMGDLKPPVCEEGTVVSNRVSRFFIHDPVKEQIIIEDLPAGKNPDGGWDHFGGILRFGPDGKLYISVGDAVNPLAAQNLSMLNGKILRLNPNGSIPEDNPFRVWSHAKQVFEPSPIYLYGVRNVFGMDFLLDTLYFTDNGPVGHDEINVGVAGGNFGWPYYAGNTTGPGYEDEGDIPEPVGTYIEPIMDFTPAIVPTGIAHYFGGNLGSSMLVFGSFLDRDLMRLRLDTDTRAWYVEDLFHMEGFSTLSMLYGTDGFLYLSTFDKIVRVILV